jgi:agmatine deiminase
MVWAVVGTGPQRPACTESYVNFDIANDVIIVPCFRTATDEAARAVPAKLLPEREIIVVPGREILLDGGNIHCITQQQPARKR